MVKHFIKDTLQGHFDDAVSINQSITPEGVYEENQKLVNGLYLKKLKYESDTLNGVGAHYVFDSAEVSQLESVAYQKAILGGDAVYLARVLLWIEVRDDGEMETRSLMRKKDDRKVSSFKLYPNPNDGNMTIEYKIEGNQIVVLSIYDMVGRLVKQQTLNAQSNLEFINAAELNSGVYYYIIKEGNKNVKTEKLVIVK